MSRIQYSVKLVSKHWMPFGYGIILPWAIYVREDARNVPYVVAHEKVHEAQINEEGGYAKWFIKYLWQWVQHGDKLNPYEVEARLKGAANQWSYLDYAEMD